MARRFRWSLVKFMFGRRILVVDLLLPFKYQFYKSPMKPFSYSIFLKTCIRVFRELQVGQSPHYFSVDQKTSDRAVQYSNHLQTIELTRLTVKCNLVLRSCHCECSQYFRQIVCQHYLWRWKARLRARLGQRASA